MKYSILTCLTYLTCLTSCNIKPSNEIDALAEEVIKKHEGIDIQLKPIDPEPKTAR